MRALFLSTVVLSKTFLGLWKVQAEACIRSSLKQMILQMWKAVFGSFATGNYGGGGEKRFKLVGLEAFRVKQIITEQT